MVREKMNKEINREKGSILLFTIISLSIMTILFATLISVTFNRLSSTKKTADANDFQGFLENLGNYYLGEMEYIQELAFMAADYYIKADYFRARFPSEFTTELYEGAKYNDLLKVIITPEMQSNYNTNFANAEFPATKLVELNIMANSVYERALIHMLNVEMTSAGTHLPQEEVRYVNRIEEWRLMHNAQLVEKYDLPAGSEPIRTTITTEKYGLTSIKVIIKNEIELDVQDNLFVGVKAYEHTYEFVIAPLVDVSVSEIPGLVEKYQANIRRKPTDFWVEKWQLRPVRTP